MRFSESNIVPGLVETVKDNHSLLQPGFQGRSPYHIQYFLRKLDTVLFVLWRLV